MLPKEYGGENSSVAELSGEFMTNWQSLTLN
jgi:hypothetical protein